jgi:hypothetical protein
MDFASTRSRNCNQTTTELTNRCLGVDFIAKFSALLPDLLPITQFLGARSDHQANVAQHDQQARLQRAGSLDEQFPPPRLFGSPDQTIRPAPANADCHLIGNVSDHAAAVLALVTIPARPAIAPPQQLGCRRLAVQQQASTDTALNTTAAALHDGGSHDAGRKLRSACAQTYLGETDVTGATPTARPVLLCYAAARSRERRITPRLHV